MTLKPGDAQQLLVRAHYTDGHAADVTRWVKFSSSDESVAPVDAQGHVKVIAPGQCVVSGLVRQPDRGRHDQCSVPESRSQPMQSPKRRGGISLMNCRLAKLKRLNLPPSTPATDGQFIRRAMLDTIGVLPTADETRKFLADTSPGKRDRLIDSLLHRREFVDYWTYKWSDLLLVNSEKLPKPAMWTYSRWIRSQVEQNVPWDQLARSIVTASGSTLENGAANFFVLHQDPMELAETTSQAFLGMSINCAHCHNHPLEKWTNDQYYGMANLFSRVQVKNAEGEGNWTVFSTTSGELIQPRTGRPQHPCPLDGKPIAFDALGDRREVLAQWLTAPENPYFSRAICNRVWANFFGVGLVEAVDDMRLSNPPSNEELLAALAKFLVDKHYDIQALIREILQSETYQRSSESLPENEADRRFYSHCFPRRLKAEVLLDAIVASDRRADGIFRLRSWLAGRAIARLERRLVFSQIVRPAGSIAHLRMRADQYAEHGPGSAHQQRQHAQSKTGGERQPARSIAGRQNAAGGDHRRGVSERLFAASPQPARNNS